jgi:hypothetical protein
MTKRTKKINGRRRIRRRKRMSAAAARSTRNTILILRMTEKLSQVRFKNER